uniref:Uncharacterized protein n=1 Tax=Chromera velia CCMP2878 TaxID=1169474 RepID=A0A0G4IBS0_9ALVE|eukprot:Cvel_12874.t1-p1 / transcript=Cvel_12874.t1 / gene=Cvel_12874 / organism=Chromera_velia_CCMP2878 / gene_product=hypothetical protein / transcript_product=hypothetical protein / location=Cvel_scaffold859:29219-40894(-) / protein_length=245 / sequence_SO=supercontig / SO=protein_coding / is_pseudo=false
MIIVLGKRVGQREGFSQGSPCSPGGARFYAAWKERGRAVNAGISGWKGDKWFMARYMDDSLVWHLLLLAIGKETADEVPCRGVSLHRAAPWVGTVMDTARQFRKRCAGGSTTCTRGGERQGGFSGGVSIEGDSEGGEGEKPKSGGLAKVGGEKKRAERLKKLLLGMADRVDLVGGDDLEFLEVGLERLNTKFCERITTEESAGEDQTFAEDEKDESGGKNGEVPDLYRKRPPTLFACFEDGPGRY